VQGKITTILKESLAESNAQSVAKDSSQSLRLFLRCLAIGLGAIHAWTAVVQQSMSEDGISYLDMGDAYLRGDWSTAINTVWSPLYAWIQGLTMAVFQPSMAWEFPLVHLVNFAIFLFALASFEYFWRQVMPRELSGSAPQLGDKVVQFPKWVWLSVGYALFIWSSLCLIKIWAVTPDMLVAGFVYVAGGFLLRISKGEVGWATFFGFGLVLGLAYLAKAVMFPIAFAFMAAGLLAAGAVRGARTRMLATLFAFSLIAGPFISLLSLSKGTLTFSDAGTLTYLRYANRIPYPHWRSDLVSGVGTPHHPARQIFENPAVFEFAAPVGGTYPLSYDPSYWYEGVSPRLDIKSQAEIVIASGQFYFDLFVRQQGGMIAIVLLLLLARTKRFLWHQKWARGDLGILVVSCVAFGLYALVYVEGRYIGAFVVLFWAGLLSLVRLSDSQLLGRLLRVGGAVFLLFIVINISSFNLEGLSKIRGKQAPIVQTTSVTEAPKYRPLQMAETILEMGIHPGDEIAYVGYSFGAFFARLARLRIIAEIPDSDAEQFWRADHSARSQVIQAITSTGAKAIIAEWVSSGASPDGWERIGHSRHFIYRLR
jgi:hypothetical protein